MNRFWISFSAGMLSIALHHPALAADHKEMIQADGQGFESVCDVGVFTICSTISVESHAKDKARDAVLVAAEAKCSDKSGVLEDEDDDKKLKSVRHITMMCGQYYGASGPGMVCRAHFHGNCITEAPERPAPRVAATRHDYATPIRREYRELIQSSRREQQLQQSYQGQDTGLLSSPGTASDAQ